MRISAIIVAAGKGTRIDPARPKQYMEICGRPMLAYTLDLFENCEIIDELIVVTNDLDFLANAVTDKYCYTKVKPVLGGKTRQESVYCGLMEVSRDIDIVMIHDGARPFVSDDDICRVANAAIRYGSCALGVRVKDTIKVCDIDNRILHTPNRNTLWAMQTPQAFKHDILVRAHKMAMADGFTGTDDVSLTERLGYTSYVVPGAYENIKITTVEDLAYGEWLIKHRAAILKK